MYGDTVNYTLVWMFAIVFSLMIVRFVFISNNDAKRKERSEKLRKLRAIRRAEFEEQYEVTLPSTAVVKKRVEVRNSPAPEQGILTLDYPEWEFSKKDGTRDFRHKDNYILENTSDLEIGEWVVEDENPFFMYCLALDLRENGHEVKYCREEQEKHDKVKDKALDIRKAQSIVSIVSEFKDSPTDFENYCADLLRLAGWEVEVTPPTRDGGFDLKLIDKEGVVFLAECKCYAPSNRIGRPVIQKLQGANVLENADGLLVITTSNFTKEARDYADKTGVILLDGGDLLDLQKEALSQRREEPLTKDYHTLTAVDILNNIPGDMRQFYGESCKIMTERLKMRTLPKVSK